ALDEELPGFEVKRLAPPLGLRVTESLEVEALVFDLVGVPPEAARGPVLEVAQVARAGHADVAPSDDAAADALARVPGRRIVSRSSRARAARAAAGARQAGRAGPSAAGFRRYRRHRRSPSAAARGRAPGRPA